MIYAICAYACIGLPSSDLAFARPPSPRGRLWRLRRAVISDNAVIARRRSRRGNLLLHRFDHRKAKGCCTVTFPMAFGVCNAVGYTGRLPRPYGPRNDILFVTLHHSSRGLPRPYGPRNDILFVTLYHSSRGLPRPYGPRNDTDFGDCHTT